VTFVDISAMRADCCMKFYTTVKQYNTTLSPRFVELYLKMTKPCCFNRDNPHFSAFKHHAGELSRVHWNYPDL